MAVTDRAQKTIEINKEIIRLRQPVRKARICIINKLTREAKKLRTKRGDEKQLEKNKRKSEKLGREVVALKDVKDDEITRFGITNLEKLQDMAQDPSAPEKTRIIAKVANHKSLHVKITEFIEKFPNYEEYLSSKEEKNKKWKFEEKKSETNVAKLNAAEEATNANESSEEEAESNSEDDSEDDNDETNDDNKHDNDSDEATGSLSSEIEETEDQDDIPNKSSNKMAAVNSKKSQVKQNLPSDEIESKKKKIVDKKSLAKEKANRSVKVISKQATVKRFTEVLEDEDGDHVSSDSEVPESENKNTEIEKTVDDFFMSGDNNGAHFVHVPTTIEDSSTIWRVEPEEKHFSKSQNRKHKERSFADTKKWENPQKRKGKWNNTEQKTQDRRQNKVEQQDFRKKNTEPEAKKRKTTQDFKPPAESENLHPSWQARKKQQEIMKQGFQGKKIVFGDD